MMASFIYQYRDGSTQVKAVRKADGLLCYETGIQKSEEVALRIRALIVPRRSQVTSNVRSHESVTLPLNAMTSSFALFAVQGHDLAFQWPGNDAKYR